MSTTSWTIFGFLILQLATKVINAEPDAAEEKITPENVAVIKPGGADIDGSVDSMLDGNPDTKVAFYAPLELSFPLGQAECMTEIKIFMTDDKVSTIDCTSAGCACSKPISDYWCSYNIWTFSSKIDGVAGSGAKPENLPECLYADTINIASSQGVTFIDVSFKGFSVAEQSDTDGSESEGSENEEEDCEKTRTCLSTATTAVASTCLAVTGLLLL